MLQTSKAFAAITLKVQTFELCELSEVFHIRETFEVEEELLIKFWGPVVPSPLFFEEFPQKLVGQYRTAILLFLWFIWEYSAATCLIMVATLRKIGDGIFFSGCPGRSSGTEWRITLGFPANTRWHIVLITGMLTHLGTRIGSGISSNFTVLRYVVITAESSFVNLLLYIGFD